MNNPIPSEYMVRVQCMTYNHAPYIEDAMNGFCMQETDFPFVCVIVDDASTDGEQEVIKRYLKNNFDLQDDQCFREEDTDDYHLTFARHKSNRNCYFGVLLLNYNHWGKKAKAPYYEEWSKAKYIAFCEGDDYWIDSQKLYKQVFFLEKNEDYGMVYTAYRNYNQKDNLFYDCDLERDTNFEKLLFSNKIQTPTTIIRKEIYTQYVKDINPIAIKKKWKMGDYPLWLYTIANTNVRYYREITCVYRILESSASHCSTYKKSVDFTNSFYNCSLYYANRYNASKKIKKEITMQGVCQIIGIAKEYNKNPIQAAFKFLISNHVLSYKYYLWVLLCSFRRGRRVAWRFVP